ncbi:MAG: hypothetical protein U1A78_21715 [Polyangia bacterium]
MSAPAAAVDVEAAAAAEVARAGALRALEARLLASPAGLFAPLPGRPALMTAASGPMVAAAAAAAAAVAAEVVAAVAAAVRGAALLRRSGCLDGCFAVGAGFFVTITAAYHAPGDS